MLTLSKATVKFMLTAGCVPVVKVVLSNSTALVDCTLINIILTWELELININLT